MLIKCDFHIHSEHSIDGIVPVKKIIEVAKKKGFSCIAIADHNTMRGANEAMELTKGESSFCAVPAAEYATEKGHILGLFLESEPQNLVPVDDFHYTFDSVISEIKRCGGLAFFAHPFKEKSRDRFERAIFSEVDGIEIFNSRAGCKRYLPPNDYAADAAAELLMPFTAGSDAHVAAEIGNAALYLEVDSLSLSDIKEAVLKRGGRVRGRNSKAFSCAFSAWNKQIKKKKYKRIPKQILYFGYCIGIDIWRVIWRR